MKQNMMSKYKNLCNYNSTSEDTSDDSTSDHIPNNNEINYLKYKMTCMSKQINILTKKLSTNKNQYLQLVSEIDSMTYFEIDQCKISNEHQCECPCVTNNIKFYDTSKTHCITYDYEDSIVFITMVGGGGAGGIGQINGLYYLSGGGGGSGASYIKKPIFIKKGSKIMAKVGSGGKSNINENGSDSILTIVYPCNKICKIIAKGGYNGYPTIDNKTSIKCGKGGVSLLNKCFSGSDGQDGMMTIPSQIQSIGGNGGNSHFYDGGIGGQNYFEYGENSDNTSNEVNLIGHDGYFGSGGGGSCPRGNIDYNYKLSGDGGNGYIYLEW